MRKIRGECPDTETLVRAVENSLPADARTDIAGHLAVCGLCANEARMLREAENPGSPDPQVLKSSEKRIREKVHRLLNHAAGPRSRTAVLRVIAAALAVMVLLLAYPAYVGLKQILPGDSSAEMGSMEVIKLESAVRRSTLPAATAFEQPAGDSVGLMFFVPIQGSPGVNYDCQIRRGAATLHEVHGIKSFDGLGNFLLTLRARHLTPSPDYLLIVTESGANAREWQFPFTIMKQKR